MPCYQFHVLFTSSRKFFHAAFLRYLRGSPSLTGGNFASPVMEERRDDLNPLVFHRTDRGRLLGAAPTQAGGRRSRHGAPRRRKHHSRVPAASLERSTVTRKTDCQRWLSRLKQSSADFTGSSPTLRFRGR